MKKAIAFCMGAIVLWFAISCSGEKNSGAGKPRVIVKGDRPNDTTVWYDSEIGTVQKSYRKEMQANWNIRVMHPQQKATPEKLNGVVLQIGVDSTFSGKAICNTIGGIYTIKGTSIKFSKIFSTKMACPEQNKEGMFLKLLEETVSAYSVSDEKLLLRDGASNIVFE
ncbi:MAG: META domain-containing protein, partial [Bacteroidota bacterium]